MLARGYLAVREQHGFPLPPNGPAKIVQFAKPLYESIQHACLHTLCWIDSLKSAEIHKELTQTKPIARVWYRISVPSSDRLFWRRQEWRGGASSHQAGQFPGTEARAGGRRSTPAACISVA